MSFLRFKSKYVSATLALLLWGIMIRAVVYFLLPPVNVQAEQGVNSLFFSALTDHFGDYISHINLIPPVSYIINAFVFRVFDVENALHIRAFFLVLSVMNLAAITLLFNASQKAGAGKQVSFLLLVVFSAVLVPFELWRESRFYDHHTIFFASFFAWSLVTLIKNENRYAGMLWVSVAGALLVAQSAVNTAIVPTSIVLVLAFVYIPVRQFRKLTIGLFITLLLPVTSLVIIGKKNQSVGDESLGSTKAGPAMMMVVQRSYNYDTAVVRTVAKEAGAPEWYLWTYDHASVTVDKSTGQNDRLMTILNQAFGICFYSDSLVDIAGPFGFDFHPLLKHLRQNDSLTFFTHLVEQDSIDALHKPYRFAGYSPSLSPRWIGVYGNVSKKIYFKTLLKNPAGMLKSFIIQQGIFSIYGPLFPFNVMKKETNLLVRSGLRSLSDKIPLDPLFGFLALLFAVLSWTTYGASLLAVTVVFIRTLLKKKSVVNTVIKPFLFISIPVVLNALVFSCLVGGENDRYFMQITPYIVLLATMLPLVYGVIRNQFQPNRQFI